MDRSGIGVRTSELFKAKATFAPSFGLFYCTTFVRLALTLYAQGAKWVHRWRGYIDSMDTSDILSRARTCLALFPLALLFI